MNNLLDKYSEIQSEMLKLRQELGYEEKLLKVKELAEKLIADNGLTDWKFYFDESIRRYGCCHCQDKKITLSKELAELNSDEQNKDVILHEIAHAVLPANEGHGYFWREKARELGCRPVRCYSAEVIQPRGRFLYFCPNCNRKVSAVRKYKRNKSCGKCCNKYNQGKYDERFILQLGSLI
mgnify:CR=1 FL=1